ncbi:alpha/beta fold hydrolase [Flammeovirga kamogawensis]|uniref:Alpha/beta hydrolase n=1 Tax=Flammeovirga kamogawensis TaxID=373891 RepID=A0ABX8H4N1_9BACT|nr:alpha/beta hydrolase [Flammeovirga kamogawensis]MBB6461869.1 pimeloyl-ACP methyl ester carboxylesterase [Flammeovirga kamogawensis]QWG10517.1 alpha/beta hydrolase [Flammeovirga kamogawensis]TRX63626.1 alpha/beta hydrolase [Flammeovirga kamogawensis]
MKFTHQSDTFIEIDSAKIYFEEIGNPQKQPLLFLHGGFGNIEDFNGIIPLLKNEYRIIGIDSRGQGKSTLGNTALTYARIEKDIEVIIKQLNLVNPVILGFSDGGISALRLTSSNSLKVDKLIIIGSSWHSKSLASSKVFLEAITSEKWKERFPETYEQYQNLNLDPDFDKLTKAMVKMWIDETSTGHPDETVQNIDCPTLIIRGDKDHLCSKQSSFELSELINAADLANIPFCGHEVFTDQKNILMEIVNQFLVR